MSPRPLPPFPRLIDADSFSTLQVEHLQEGCAFLVDKPEGVSSFWVVRKLRWLCKVKKVGHAGTLDPFATGLLIVLTGKGTRHQDAFMGQSKTYEAVFLLGQRSDTCDRTGQVEIVHEGECPFDEAALETALDTFRGEITQTVPAFSAVKVGGKRLYKSARKGEEVERPSRQVEIHSLEILGFVWPLLRLRVNCSKGTYIRSIASDLGDLLGTGALVQELRRTSSGEFDIQKALTIDELEPRMMALRDVADAAKATEATVATVAAEAAVTTVAADATEAADASSPISSETC